MEYKQFTLEELQNMFEKEQKLEELNKIMNAISGKYDVLSDNKETNNFILQEEIYQQIYHIKREDLNVLPLEEIRRKLDKKMVK